MDSEPVLEAVDAAGVLGDVAADAAGNLARRIRRVIKPERRDCIGNCEVAHPRLHTGGARPLINFHDAHEFREREQHAVAERQGAAGEPGAGAARDHRHLELVAGLQNAADLVLGFRQCNCHGDLAVGGQPVAFVGLHVLVVEQQRSRGKKDAQRRDHLALAGKINRNLLYDRCHWGILSKPECRRQRTASGAHVRTHDCGTGVAASGARSSFNARGSSDLQVGYAGCMQMSPSR
ncbi:hypothetical protein D3C83_04570 [compost metagenome]